MSTPKKLSELPLASDIAENDTVTVVDDTGNNVRVPWKNLCPALKLSVRNLIKSTFYSKTEPGAKFTKGYVCAHDDTIRFQLPNKISLQTILRKRGGSVRLDKVHKRIVRKEVVAA